MRTKETKKNKKKSSKVGTKQLHNHYYSSLYTLTCEAYQQIYLGSPYYLLGNNREYVLSVGEQMRRL